MAKKKITICLICVVVSLALCEAAEVEQSKKTDVEESSAAMKAFELRMAGKADEAKGLLEKALAENPEEATGYYELARTKFHMALGNPGKNIADMFGDAQKSIDRAVQLDPKNVTYASFAGKNNFMQAYYGLMTGGQPKEKLAKAIGAFESALKLKPDHHQAALYLVELYSRFPEEAGGDKSKAEQYARRLEGTDSVFGAKARSMLLPEDVDRIDYWQKVLKKHEGNENVIEELGKAYLRADKVDRAVSCFEKAIEINPEKNSLFLDLSIYHTFRAMRAGDDEKSLQASIASGDAAIARYIDSESIQPMLAYALGVRSKYKSHSGDKEQGQALFKQAETLDSYFSKATGAPDPDLFIGLGEISQKHRYLMRPF